ncbi:hypothetical protein C455_00667 [Haloferax larsenii JCM 13917]|nr:hypothetical protein [Haloferax larsenii]ELZ84172.1 hypothetical protein C455_00667 [Haloferax larsenii JCM 13917]
MSKLKKVVFTVADVATEERLIREYVASAFERLEARDDAQWPVFNRYGQDPSVSHGEVVFYLVGDTEALIRDERSRWDDLVDNGLVDEWELVDPNVDVTELDDRQRLQFRLRYAASRMSLACLDTFDPLPDALDEFEDEDYAVGWGSCLHHLINQLGYQGNGGEEEIDLLFQSLVGRLYATNVSAGPETTLDKIGSLKAELDELAEQLQEQAETR